jgi:hypothetical protein
MQKYPVIIDDYMAGKTNETVSLYDLRCFVGMLQTGECTLQNFADAGVDLLAICKRYGSANCWTGTSGKIASELLEMIKKCK